MSEEYKKIADFHTILEIPKGSRPPVFAGLPEVGTFTRTQLERDVLAMSRTFWVSISLVGAPGDPGAALRDLCKASRFQGTSAEPGRTFRGLAGRRPPRRRGGPCSFVHATAPDVVGDGRKAFLLLCEHARVIENAGFRADEIHARVSSLEHLSSRGHSSRKHAACLQACSRSSDRSH